MLDAVPSWLLTASLAGCGLLALPMAIWRWRKGAARIDRLVSISWMLLALISVSQAIWIGVDRLPLFTAAEWNAAEGRLTLHRSLPFSDVELAPATIESITEMLLPEHTLVGVRPMVQFQLRTKDGKQFESRQVYREADRMQMLASLAPATGGRVARFFIGQSRLQ